MQETHNQIKISIIVPVYNVKNYLTKCVDSILVQTYDNWECILVDDGSTDDSGLICDSYADIDCRIKVIHKENGGVSSARNIGISIATGDYICFVDSDDFIELDYFEQVFRYLKDNDCVCLINNYFKDDGRGNIVNKFQDNTSLVMDNNTAMYEMIKGKNFGWEPVASFYEAKALKAIRFDETISFGEDLLFNYCFNKGSNGKFLYVPIVKYHYMFRESSACNSYSINKKMDDIKVMEYIMNRENNRIGNLLFTNEYLPRLISRLKSAIYFDGEENRTIIIDTRNKIRKHFWNAISNNEVKLILKMKLIVALLPNSFVKKIDGFFQYYKH